MGVAARRVDVDFDAVLSRLRRSGEVVAERPEPRQDGARPPTLRRLGWACSGSGLRLSQRRSVLLGAVCPSGYPGEGDHDRQSHGVEGDASPPSKGVHQADRPTTEDTCKGRHVSN